MLDADFDVIVIGGGVVGLAIAAELAPQVNSIALLERHLGFGEETSSRNSEVIHAGIYYPAGSLKATLCVEGQRSLYHLCALHNIPHRRCGKIIVARNEAEIRELESLRILGTANGVGDLRLLTAGEVRAMEPHVSAQAGLYSPESGILNVHILMDVFARMAAAAGGDLVLGAEVTGIDRTGDVWAIHYQDSDGPGKITCRAVVNSAGLDSQKIMGMAGLDPELIGLHRYLCKGDYFSVSGAKRKLLSHLIYPVPREHQLSLGIHSVIGLDGSFKLGPSAYYVDEIDYTVKEADRRALFESVRSYLPFLNLDDLIPDMSGIRPKLAGPGEDARDFYIAHEAARGAEGFFNLAGMDSPALTASPAIGRYVANLVSGYLRC
jgi:L-2-hydroxyglutarate oxidase LhgO